MFVVRLGFAVLAALLLGGESTRAEDPQRPNVLFCLADDVSFPHMGAYGCQWVKTPGFDRVAEDNTCVLRGRFIHWRGSRGIVVAQSGWRILVSRQ